MTDTDLVFEIYRAALFSCGALGFAWLTAAPRVDRRRRRAALVWLLAAVVPFAAYHGLGAMLPFEPGVRRMPGPPRMLAWVLLHATTVLCLIPARFRPDTWHRNALRGAAAVAVGLAAGLAVGMAAHWSACGSIRCGEWNTWHLRPYSLFAAVCFACSWAAARFPQRTARAVGWASAAFLALLAGSAAVVYARVPNRFWSTARLVAAFDSDLPGDGNCEPGPDYRGRRTAAAALVARRGPSTVPTLIEALGERKRDRIRKGAILALTRLGPDAEPAVPALMWVLGRERYHFDGVDVSEAYDAAVALKSIGPRTGPVLLTAVLEGTAPGMFCRPALSTVAAEQLALVRRLARADDPEVRRCASAAALKIEPFGEGPLAVLTGLLADRDRFTAQIAAEDLGTLGAEARPAAAALKRALRSPDRAREAALALTRIAPGDADAIPVLLDALDAPPRHAGFREVDEVARLKEVVETLAERFKGVPAVTARLERRLRLEKGSDQSSLVAAALQKQRGP